MIDTHSAEVSGAECQARLQLRNRYGSRLSCEWLEERQLLAVELALLKDINTIPVTFGSNPSGIVDIYGVAYFRATTATAGEELWKSDGTASGTVLVKDIWAGIGGPPVRYLTNVSGTPYFRAHDGTSGDELWKSDGTAPGTILVEDLADDGGTNPTDITPVGDRLFLVANNEVFGREIWTGVLGTRPGDFDRNGFLELADIDALVAAIASASHPLQFELNNDAFVDRLDLSRWLALGGAANLPSGNPYRPGDANLDGLVNQTDFEIWNVHKFTHTAAWSKADFNADGVTDGVDYNIWNSNKSIGPPGTGKVTRALQALDDVFARRDRERLRRVPFLRFD